MTCEEVVITGIGPISAIGIGREDFFDGLDEGRIGVRAAQNLDASNAPCNLVAECLDFYVEDYLESEKTYLDRASEFLLAACHLALDDGRLDARAMDHERIGLSVGTAYGCLKTMWDYYRRLVEKGARFASSVLFSHSYANTPVSLASIEYRIMGPTNTVCSGTTSGAGAIAYAFDLLRHGRIDAMLAGGMDALCQPLFDALVAEGVEYVPGEGAGLLLLETEAHATERTARVAGRLYGYGMAQGAEADAVAVGRAIRAALEAAEVDADRVDVVFTSANGAAGLDGCEAEAVNRAIGDHARRVALKETLGETFAASTGLAIAAAVRAIRADDVQHCLVSTLDPAGNCAAIIVGPP
ncbi:MAG: beta-ketoacyl synthase N-terminal-like domain-containing protein [Armatimonadota bacterium]